MLTKSHVSTKQFFTPTPTKHKINFLHTTIRVTNNHYISFSDNLRHQKTCRQIILWPLLTLNHIRTHPTHPSFPSPPATLSTDFEHWLFSDHQHHKQSSSSYIPQNGPFPMEITMMSLVPVALKWLLYAHTHTYKYAACVLYRWHRAGPQIVWFYNRQISWLDKFMVWW